MYKMKFKYSPNVGNPQGPKEVRLKLVSRYYSRECHDLDEILLKLALNTNQSINYSGNIDFNSITILKCTIVI